MTNVLPLFAEDTTPAQTAAPNRFDEFWGYCPLKKGKAAAKALYARIIAPGGCTTRTLVRDSGCYEDIQLEATEDELIEGMKRYAASVCGNRHNNYKRSEFICHPTTFLNQGRWMDE